MVKVFLVEDEFIVREGIKNNIDWSKFGYEFCGEASDGELAFPMIQKLKPDIVITDIRMPFMDGLELSKLIKKELPETEIIILSGHEEFEYAKEAIRIGVAEYLLKPINGEDLLKQVDEVALKIVEKRKESEIKRQYIQEMEENILNEKKVFFQHLVSGSKSLSELLDMAGKLGIDLSAMWYNVMLFKVQSQHHAYNEYSNSLIEIEKRINQINTKDVLIFDRNLEGKALLFKADSRDTLENLQNEYIMHMKEIFAEYDYIHYFGGIGEPVNRLSELPDSFERAGRAFAHRYLMKESFILNSKDLEQEVYFEKENFNISDVDTRQIDRRKIKGFLKLGELEESIYFVEEFFNDLGSNAMKSNMFRQYIIMDAYFCVIDFLIELKIPKEEIEQPDIVSGVFQSEESAVEYVVQIIKKAIELRDKASVNRYDDVLNEVMTYIQDNYADEDISLNLLASHVNFSPNHLSMIFSQQTGQTFIKYLTDYRMNKAKELLRCTGKRSSVISMEVGYKDPHYFSYLFKKTQGMTPTQYRNGKLTEGEE